MICQKQTLSRFTNSFVELFSTSIRFFNRTTVHNPVTKRKRESWSAPTVCFQAPVQQTERVQEACGEYPVHLQSH